MISFKKIEELLTQCESDTRRQALADVLEVSEFVYEALATFSHGCLLLRVLEDERGDYFFPYPMAVDEAADVALALEEISLYAVKESIPEIITEVLPEDVPTVLRGARHVNLDAMDEGGNLYTVSVKTECMLAKYVPDVSEGRIYLGELCSAYADGYAALCSDGNVNRYFGYDYREDMPNASGADLLREAEREFALGIAVNFAATVLSEDGENVFVGDAALYAFDGRGGAHVCFRLLPEWWGQGLGTEIFSAVTLAAESLGLVTLYAEAMEENAPSVSVLEKRMSALEDDGDGIKRYIMKLS